jgi:EpsD family peptidyl-prolyl cis-trans isomerase
MSLQACSSEPTGQVVAIVNGEEITQSELNAEISSLGIPPTGDKQEIRRQILQQLLDRRLMAQIAQEEGFDKNPDFLSRERRLREELLVQMYSQKIAETVGVPDQAAVKKYLTENPGKFAERAVYSVDQIAFDYPADPRVLKALEADKTLEDVERTLTGFKVKYVRGPNSLDSISVPAQAMKQILGLPPGEPFVVPAQGKVTVSVITGKRPVQTTEQEVAPLAAQEIRTGSLAKVLQSRLEEARATADISYQGGLAPAKPTPAAKPR